MSQGTRYPVPRLTRRRQQSLAHLRHEKLHAEAAAATSEQALQALKANALRHTAAARQHRQGVLQRAQVSGS